MYFFLENYFLLYIILFLICQLELWNFESSLIYRRGLGLIRQLEMKSCVKSEVKHLHFGNLDTWKSLEEKLHSLWVAESVRLHFDPWI